ncbi:hypothetical protein NPIL_704491 [Nephila pilipes]|uniref:Uncharacterized protein n=1 Tax=Nephila pilipes TaxID=299642 RepID=A0A8X6PER1_NEPPI|nr:hypothetical protein NPIL_704491 [Nephila pilipes]
MLKNYSLETIHSCALTWKERLLPSFQPAARDEAPNYSRGCPGSQAPFSWLAPDGEPTSHSGQGDKCVDPTGGIGCTWPVPQRSSGEDIVGSRASPYL